MRVIVCTPGEAEVDGKDIFLGSDCTCCSKKDTPDGFQHISENYDACLKGNLFGSFRERVQELI